MNKLVKMIVEQAAFAGGLALTEDLHNTDVLSDNVTYFCVPSVKNVEFSPRIRSADGEQFAVECRFSLGLKIFGARCGFSDFAELERRITDVVSFIGLSANCVASKLERRQILRSDICGRLTGEIFAQLIILCCGEEDENGTYQS